MESSVHLHVHVGAHGQRSPGSFAFFQVKMGGTSLGAHFRGDSDQQATYVSTPSVTRLFSDPPTQ